MFDNPTSRLSSNCVSGFDIGSIKWDDEDHNNGNGNDGTLPDGSYDGDTTMFYCCRYFNKRSNQFKPPQSNNMMNQGINTIWRESGASTK